LILLKQFLFTVIINITIKNIMRNKTSPLRKSQKKEVNLKFLKL